MALWKKRQLIPISFYDQISQTKGALRSYVFLKTSYADLQLALFFIF